MWWLYVFMIVLFIIFVVIIMWQTNIVIVDLETQNYLKDLEYYNYYNYNNDNYYNNDNEEEEEQNYDDDRNDLDDFEKHYIDTLPLKFLQKAEKISKPSRQFSYDDNIFIGLDPWTRVADFGTLLHTLIGYGVRFRDVDDPLYLNFDLAEQLYQAMYTIYDHLPIPAPTQQAPWGNPADWYHFSITMPECFQHVCIVLRGFFDLTQLTESLLYYYLPSPTHSMGWQRTAGNAIRMCLPYTYGQLLRGYYLNEIAKEQQVKYVIDLIHFSLVKSGNGVHYDYVYFDHIDVRAYGYLINSYFTFSYYNYLFGENTVNLDNVNRSLMLISNYRGFANPALISRTGSTHSEVLAHFIEYPNDVVAADFNKILTVRNKLYFGSLVGQTFNVAYYEADTTNSLHAPLWAMTRKIWSNQSRALRYRNLGLESGILLTTNLNGVVDVPSTSTSTSSFYPTIAYTAIATTNTAGVMIMHVRFEELNIEFHSYTLYHRNGMFHLYDRIKSLQTIANNARCVVLTRDTTFEPKWITSSNILHANGVVAKHHNIINNSSLSNFDVRTFDNLDLQTAEQIISADAINNGVGVACFSLLVQETFNADNTIIERVFDTDIFIITTDNNNISCVIDFPIVVLKDDETRQLTINDATNASKTTHHLSFDKIIRPLSLLSLSVDNLKISSSDMVRDHDRFTLFDVHGNQFKFTFT
uniref:ODV-E66 n=1 Tax=Spodoptera frugiperda nuclear polyhedrosis virus TaxID=10455 RepID=A0A891XLI8_NPVSF|nr:ODV-E66 [Spodoptera frugiperda multiple nucleopolyhedrovirus]